VFLIRLTNIYLISISIYIYVVGNKGEKEENIEKKASLSVVVGGRSFFKFKV